MAFLDTEKVIESFLRYQTIHHHYHHRHRIVLVNGYLESLYQ